MSNVNPRTDEPSNAGNDGDREGRLQDAVPSISAQQEPTLETENETAPDAETQLHLDGEATGETETLYRDGLNLDEDYDTPAGTRGSAATIP
jgi:hypothetical protein